MHLHWFGHSCFQMTFSSGIRIITDPFDEYVGYRVPAVPSDVVTCSHNHSDHGYAQIVQSNPTVIRDAGPYEIGGVRIEGMQSFHDAERGAKRGQNMIYRFRGDGLTVVHLGDLGHVPTPEQYDFIRGADVLMIPVGGFYTIDTDTALQIIAEARPHTAIAMHFKTPAINFPISDEAQFADALHAARVDTSDMDFTADTMQDQPAAVVMSY